MARKGPVRLQFPMGGLDKRHSYRQQPPYTTPDCLNVRPDGSLEGRARGGSRPGLETAQWRQLGNASDDTVDRLNTINVELITNNYLQQDEFFAHVTQLPDNWTAEANATAAPSFAHQLGAYAPAAGTYAMIRDHVTDINFIDDGAVDGTVTTDLTSVTYSILISPDNGAYGGIYSIWYSMGGTDYLDPGGARLELTLTGSTGDYSVKRCAYMPLGGCTGVVASGNLGYLGDVWLTVIYSEEASKDGLAPTMKRTAYLQKSLDGQGRITLFTDVNILWPRYDSYTGTGTITVLGNEVDVDPTWRGIIDLGAERVVGETVTFADTSNVHTIIAETHSNENPEELLYFDDLSGETPLGPQGMTATFPNMIGPRWGFQLQNIVQGSFPSSRCVVKQAREEFGALTTNAAYQVDSPVRRDYLVAVCGGYVHMEDDNGELQAHDSNQYFHDGGNAGIERLGALYYPEQYDIFQDAQKWSTAIAAGDASHYSIDVSENVTGYESRYLWASITERNGSGCSTGYYKWETDIDNNNISISKSLYTLSTGDCYVTFVSRGKTFDGTTVGYWEPTSGTIPEACTLAVLYRDRVVLAGDPDNPHVWYMSRQGDPLDWDYGHSITDAQRAVAGTNTTAGLIAAPITALVPHSDDYLLFGCWDSLWVLRGDPASGGQIDALSHSIGIAGPNAWCYGPAGETIFLSHDGLYVLGAGAGQYPIALSRDKLPRDLDLLKNTAITVWMAYDTTAQGVHIFLTTTEATSNHWWFDWLTRSFWPLSLAGTHEPTQILPYNSYLTGERNVLIPGSDRYIRYFNPSRADDDGTNFASHVMYGPMRFDDFRDSMMVGLIGVTAVNGGSVDWAVYAADNVEAIRDATASATGTWTAGSNNMVHPRVRGGALALKLTNNANTQSWAMESAAAVIKQAGKVRL